MTWLVITFGTFDVADSYFNYFFIASSIFPKTGTEISLKNVHKKCSLKIVCFTYTILENWVKRVQQDAVKKRRN